jgi:DNA-binding transcriptional LysR family regulator
MLERHEIETFLAVAEELHFGRAAARLRLSTARVSQTVKGLELRIGASLFERTSRRVELTPIGRQLQLDLAPAWAEVMAARGRAVDAAQGIERTLRVAFAGPAAGQLVAGAADRMRQRLAGCRVELREAQPGEAVAWLRDGEVDVALATLPVGEPGIVAGPVLVREPAMLAVPSGDPLARRASVSTAELGRLRVIELPGPEAATLTEALTLVGLGAGVVRVGAHVRRYHARPDVTYVSLAGDAPLEWAVLWRAANATAPVRAFARAARELAAEH